MKIERLEEIPRQMVGDGKSPNVYFVSVFEKENPRGLVLIARDFDIAYNYWRNLPTNIETCLEDRKIGVIASTSPIDDGSPILQTIDDSSMVLKKASYV